MITQRKQKIKKILPTRVVTLMLVFLNIYEIFCPMTLLKHMLITNQYFAKSYYLINSVIITLTALLRWIFILRVFKA